jgi:hypothetical protein
MTVLITATSVAPSQIWPALSPDQQRPVVQLLARLALHLAVARATSPTNAKEVPDAAPDPRIQNPARPS